MIRRTSEAPMRTTHCKATSVAAASAVKYCFVGGRYHDDDDEDEDDD